MTKSRIKKLMILSGNLRIAFLIVCLLAGSMVSIARELPLPIVPDSLTQPMQRADFIMLHFWDDMDFADVSALNDETYMSQNFANFASIYPHASQEGASQALSAYLQKSMASTQACDIVSDLAESYLLSKESPVFNEQMYLDMAAAMDSLSYPNSERRQWLVEMTLQNRPGSLAPDFEYIDQSDGKTKSFISQLQGKNTVLIFYNPDCDDCHKVIDELHRSAQLKDEIAAGRTQVIGIYPDGDRQLWSRYTLPYPFITGFDTGRILDQDLYLIPANPTLYLISPTARILLKDPSPSQLLNYPSPSQLLNYPSFQN